MSGPSAPQSVECDLAWALTRVARDHATAVQCVVGTLPGGQRGFQVLAAAAGEQGAEEDVFHPDQAGAGGFGDFLAAGGVGGVAPDGDEVVRGGLAEAEGVAGEFHDPAGAALAEETGVEIENPPVTCVAGGFLVVLWVHYFPPSVSTAVATEPIVPSEPVRAEITLLH